MRERTTSHRLCKTSATHWINENKDIRTLKIQALGDDQKMYDIMDAIFSPERLNRSFEGTDKDWDLVIADYEGQYGEIKIPKQK